MKPLAGKVAIVTGAGRGIGRATAIRLAENGAHVVINDLDNGPGLEAKQAAEQSGEQCVVVLGSVSEPKVASAMVDAALSQWGRLDILVNNAGITRDAMIHRMTDEQFQGVMDVIVRGAFNCIRAAASSMRDAGKKDLQMGNQVHRKIVNVSSIAGLHGAVGNANYATAKAAIIGLTKAIAREWAPFRINCNAVAPGIIDTRMSASRDQVDGTGLGIPAEIRQKILSQMPFGRIGTPDEVAGAIEFLCSPSSDFITGQVLQIDGGVEFINVVA